jgi:purine nucleosidase
MQRQVVIDTDPGIDDALALLMALASPELCVHALTVVEGNCTLDQAVRNTLSIVELMGSTDVPVMRGSRKPMLRPSMRHKLHLHGPTGLGHAHLPHPSIHTDGRHASTGLIDIILSHPHQITVVALAPLTNLALAILIEPSIVELMHKVIIMGGALDRPGNFTDTAEFNIYNDPHAAEIVLSSGAPITLIPLDATKSALIEEDDFSALAASLSGNAVMDFCKQATRDYFKLRPEGPSGRSARLHDPLALAACIDPEVVRTKPLEVRVELCNELELGRTIRVQNDLRRPPREIHVAYDLDTRRFTDLVLERLRFAALRGNVQSRNRPAVHD